MLEFAFGMTVYRKDRCHVVGELWWYSKHRRLEVLKLKGHELPRSAILALSERNHLTVFGDGAVQDLARWASVSRWPLLLLLPVTRRRLPRR